MSADQQQQQQQEQQESNPMVLIERLHVFKAQRDAAMDRLAVVEADARLLGKINAALRDQVSALQSEIEKLLKQQEQ